MTSGPAGYRFADSERPLFPGSPFTPNLSLRRRLAYAAVAVLLGITSTLGNALVTVNVTAIAGSAGLYVAEASWLPAVFVAFSASANLLMVKARAQFGIPAVVHAALGAYAVAAVIQILWPGGVGALVLRAISGLAAGALITLTIYHLIQAFPVAKRPMALVLGVSIPQLGVPLARMLPVEFVAANSWRGLHEVELALAVLCMATTVLIPLPPTERSKAFKRLDLLTIALILPANVMLCGVLGLGRVVWWTDAPALGWLLAGASVCYIGAFLVERHRTDPLLKLDWLTGADILRFGAIALFVRLALAEQTYGAVGLLTGGGLINDQLAGLFAVVTVCIVIGAVIAAVTLTPNRLPLLVIAACVVIGIGAILDSQSNALSRPAQLYVSQALLGFGTTLFIGPALAYGFLKMIQHGPGLLVSFTVLFSTTQNIGGLAGSALLGTLQTIEARAHATSMSGSLLLSDPAVRDRLRLGGQAVAGAVVDPAARSAQGGALLGQSLSAQASSAAFDDIFVGVAIFAFATALYIAAVALVSLWRAHRAAVTA